MKATASALTLLAALLSAACGEGHAILNIDVHSFMEPSGADTLRYPPLPIDSIPPGSPAITVASDSIKFELLGALGNSVVESAHVFGIIDFDNPRGTGTLSVDVFLSADSSTIFSGTPALSFGANVTPGSVVPDTVDIDLLSTFNSLFTAPQAWVAFRASVANTGATPLQGTIRVRVLNLRVVVQENVL